MTRFLPPPSPLPETPTRSSTQRGWGRPSVGLAPLGLAQYRLAKSLSVPARRINEIVHAAAYDLDVERDRLGSRLEREVPVYRNAG